MKVKPRFYRMKIGSIIPLIFIVLPISGFSQIDSARIDNTLREAVNHHAFEGTILVAGRGEIVYHQSFGFRDADKSRPVENDTRFGIASITKMITATVVLQVIEEQKLPLTANLKLYAPL